jgi:hypothetical protein
MASVSVSYLIYLHNDNFICTFFPYTIFMCVAGCEQTRIYRVSLYFDSVWNNWKTRSCVHSHSYPVLGGVQIIGFGMFIGLVMSNLQYIDMQSTINLAIIGVSTSLLATCNTHKNGIWKKCTYKIIIMKVYQIGDRNRRHICWLSLLL